MDITVLHRMFTSTCMNRVMFIAMLTLCMLSGCASHSVTPYQASGPSQPFGYSTQQMNESTFRILYAANEHTDFDQIESYAHTRAKSLAKSQGFDWYRVVSGTADSLPERQASAPVPPEDFSAVEQAMTEKLPEQPCNAGECNSDAIETEPASKDKQTESTQLPTRFFTLVIQGGIGNAAPDGAVWVSR